MSRPTHRHPLTYLFAYGTITLYREAFQLSSAKINQFDVTGLFRVRSPLLTESRLISFPLGTEMFQFSRFASLPYVFR